MSDTFLRRARCGRCALPLRTCVCALVTPVHNDLDVLVLQHPGEVDEPKGSLRLLRLSLARCRVVVGETFEPAALRDLLGGDVSGSALLYPTGTPAGNGAALPAAVPRRLVVLDGTWRKSLRMLCANPLLQALPRWSVAPCGAGRYAALRKARRRDQLSTLEATCAALAAIEDAPARYAPLLDAFGRFVADRSARAAAARAP
jgi:DTW domain-containing protein